MEVIAVQVRIRPSQMSTKAITMEFPKNIGWILAKHLGLESFLIRRMVADQLGMRTYGDYMSAWSECNINMTIVWTFCMRVKEELEWPNPFFVPEDRLCLLLTPRGFGMNDIDFLSSCGDFYHCTDKEYHVFLDSLSTICVLDAICLLTKEKTRTETDDAKMSVE